MSRRLRNGIQDGADRSNNSPEVFIDHKQRDCGIGNHGVTRREFLGVLGPILTSGLVDTQTHWQTRLGSRQSETPSVCSDPPRLPKGSETTGNLEPGETRCYAVGLEEAERIQVKLAGVGSAFVAVGLRLYDPGRKLINEATWYVSPTSIWETVERTGDYYVVIENMSQDISHHFRLMLSNESASGSTRETAVPIELNTEVTGEITSAEEEDWYSVNVDSAGDLAVRQVVYGAIGQPYTYALIGPNGTVIASERWNGLGGPGVSRELVETVDQAATYFVRITSRYAGGYTPSTYRFEVVKDDGESHRTEKSIFEILSTDEDTEFGYRFTIAGRATKSEYNGHAADDEDQIIYCNDGQTTVVGFTGSGAGDVFTITGRITEFWVTSGPPEYELRLDDEDVTADLTTDRVERSGNLGDDSTMFEVRSTEDDTEFTYRFAVEDGVAKSESDTNAADSEDQLVQCSSGRTTVVGLTGDAQGDVFEVGGNIRYFEKTSGSDEYQLLLDGRDITDDLGER